MSISSKMEADGLEKISIFWLKKHRFLQGGYVSGVCTWTDSWTGRKSSIGLAASPYEGRVSLRLYYTQTDPNGEKKDFDYPIPMITSQCHFGGERYWFRCPLYTGGKRCGRQVGVLYKRGDYFGCRHCYNLTYNSRNKNRRGRFFPLFYLSKNYRKAMELKRDLKRKFYGGRLTRNKLRINKLFSKMQPYVAVCAHDDAMNIDLDEY